jgi:hypothetical protein
MEEIVKKKKKKIIENMHSKQSFKSRQGALVIIYQAFRSQSNADPFLINS